MPRSCIVVMHIAVLCFVDAVDHDYDKVVGVFFDSDFEYCDGNGAFTFVMRNCVGAVNAGADDAND